MGKVKVLWLLPLMLLPAAVPWQGAGKQVPADVEYLERPDLAGTRGGNLVVAVNADPPTFNRMFASLVAHMTVLDRISAGLVHINRLTFELEPALAKRWEASGDGRTYTIHLRRGLRFSDGSPCTAEDVLFSLQALQDPRSTVLLGDQVKVDGTFPAVAKVNDLAVRLTFPRPVGMGIRALDSVPILPRRLLQKALQEGKLMAAWGPGTPPGEIAGLGPFRLREYQRGSRIVLERNPYYWKRDRTQQALPYLDSITFLIVPDRNSETLRLQGGELHMIGSLTPENFAAMRRFPGRARYELRDLGPGLRMDFLWFNLNAGAGKTGTPPPDPEKRALFERPEFRRAVSHALDRSAIARAVLLGLGTPQHGPVSSGNAPWYNPQLPQAALDPARARELLGKAGLRDQNGDGTLEFGTSGRALEITLLTARGDALRERMAQVVRDNLGKVGIRVAVQAVPPNELITRLQDSLDYEAILFGFTPTDVAPDLQADLWYSSGKNHFWHPSQAKPARPWEARMDALISQLLRTPQADVRRKLFFEVQDIWGRELPAITIVAPNIMAAWDAGLNNVRPAIMAPHLLWNAEEIAWKPK